MAALGHAVREAIAVCFDVPCPGTVRAEGRRLRIFPGYGATLTWDEPVEGPLPIGLERKTRSECFTADLDVAFSLAQDMCDEGSFYAVTYETLVEIDHAFVADRRYDVEAHVDKLNEYGVRARSRTVLA